MPVKAHVADRESRIGPGGHVVKPGEPLRAYKELTVVDTRKDGHELTICVWDDGTFQVEAFSGWDTHSGGLSEAPARFKADDAPDVILAITEFLGSL